MSDNRLNELDFADKDVQINKGYSRIIKLLRIGLPLTALILTAVVIAWPEMDDKIVTIQKEELLPDVNLAENELINPKFQSRDKDLNPYTVTAKRAIQNQEMPELVKLDEPSGDLKMKDGAMLNIEAQSGSYEQKQEKLFLENNVKLTHEEGYILTSDELRVDLQKGEAFSDKDVQIEGAEGTIKATGLEGNLETEVLIFKGPATLTLNKNKPQETPVNEQNEGNTE